MTLLIGIAAVLIFMVVCIMCTGSPEPEEPTRMVSLGKRLDNGKHLRFRFDLGTHLLFAGITGFGKSNQINLVLSQLATSDDVQFLVANAKGGTDFMAWLPRASIVAIGPDATDKMVNEALTILRDRYKMLIPEGDIDTEEGMAALMAAERKIVITPYMPLVLVVIDEFVEYLKGGSSNQRAHKLHSLATLGRAVGVTLLIAAQRPSQWSAPTDIRENIPYHISFRLDKYGTEMLFGRGTMSDVPLNKLEIPGHGYAIVPGELSPVPFIAPEVTTELCASLAWQTARLRQKTSLKHLIQDAA